MARCPKRRCSCGTRLHAKPKVPTYSLDDIAALERTDDGGNEGADADEDEIFDVSVFEADLADAGQRIDAFLCSKVPDQSRTYFGDLCTKGCVCVNGSSAVKKSHKVTAGQIISVRFLATAELNLGPEDIPLDVIFEDSELLAIAKPPGMVVHPAPGNWNGTFVNALLHHLSKDGSVVSLGESGDLRPGVVHRLDKGTSGVLLAAKTPIMQKQLSQLFHDRKVRKTYLAVCAGNPGDDAIDVPIGRHATNRQKMVAVPDIQPGARARRALSHVRCTAFDGSLSVAEVRIETGRTHQIRVHLQHRRTPIVGDELYGNRDWNRRLQKRGISRPLLHALRLEFTHPTTGAALRLEAPLPEDMASIVRGVYPVAIEEHPGWFGEGGEAGGDLGELSVPARGSRGTGLADSQNWYE
ncbi:pseudouridine synthase [Tribonema minus]|uniref:Pseudouridine synthase n=1 Tax=Tribonema minus TaxID=303371 RepID=A0A836CH15_9STRA|nr:pseudouridine synthase [Tribonema minus]